jgi:hypothetical protein
VAGLEETLAVLQKARAVSPSALVAYSGGKDSLAVMDMACRTFDHVEGLFKYLVPGLELTTIIIENAKKRWGVKVHEYPSQNTITALKHGIFCNPGRGEDELPEINSWNIYAAAIRDTGIPIVLTGMKRADSQSRRRLLKWNNAHEQVLHPIAGWEKIDVVSYLRLNGIPIPAGSGSITSGIELADSELLWLYDTARDDFEKVAKIFPYIWVVPKRREFYGSKEARGPRHKRRSERLSKPRARGVHHAKGGALVTP